MYRVAEKISFLLKSFLYDYFPHYILCTINVPHFTNTYILTRVCHSKIWTLDTTLLKELVSIGFISSQTCKVWSISMKTDSLNQQK